MFRYTSARVVLLLIASTLAACVLYPLVWHAGHLSLGGAFGYPPGRVFRRVWMIAVVAGLLLARRWIGLQPPSRAGFTWNGNALRNAVLGVAVSWAFLAALSAVYALTGVWTPKPFEAGAFWDRLWTGFLRGTAVACIEEYIFRGLVFLSFARSSHWMRAAAITSLIFSMLHFLDSRGYVWEGEPGSWYSGFLLCGSLLWHMGSHFTFFPDAAGLFVIGMIMCHAFVRTGTLWYAIGLHGGWIWYGVVRDALFWFPPDFNPFLFGGNRLFNGVVPLAGMLVIFPVTAFLLRTHALAREPLPPAGKPGTGASTPVLG